MYLGKDGKIERGLTAAGYLAPGVPGTVRGLATAHRKFGKLPWKDVVSPAVDLAGNGFRVSAALARGLNNEIKGPMAKFPASVAAYGKPGGGEWAEGDTIVLGDLANTLRAIAGDGRLRGLDSRPHRHGHEGERWPDQDVLRVRGQERRSRRSG
jgi:gamma-glutamyltranspeptidase/glutathione hydrolase